MGKNAIIICLNYSKVIGSYGTNDKGQKKCGSTQLSWAVQYKKYLQYDFKLTSVYSDPLSPGEWGMKNTPPPLLRFFVITFKRFTARPTIFMTFHENGMAWQS